MFFIERKYPLYIWYKIYEKLSVFPDRFRLFKNKTEKRNAYIFIIILLFVIFFTQAFGDHSKHANYNSYHRHHIPQLFQLYYYFTS